MENQHRKIASYRELSQGEIDGMNDLKRQEREVFTQLDANLALGADPRLTAIAKTDMMKAFMVAGRAVARPEGYPNPEPPTEPT